MALDQAATAQAGQRAVLFMRSLALRHEEVARKLEASQEVRLHCSEKPCGQETGVGRVFISSASNSQISCSVSTRTTHQCKVRACVQASLHQHWPT